MNHGFPTDYQSILQRINEVDPVAYARTRNNTDGKVSHLSPYISRGVISLSMIRDQVVLKYGVNKSFKFIQEMAWREYFLRVWEHIGDGIFNDIRHPQESIIHHKMLHALEYAGTGIQTIDNSIHDLYETGYMHNHVRMYVASIACNIGRAHWLEPSRWMYRHLLDGDPASNSLSWQWVSGCFSSKKYYCNQDNINEYTKTEQKGTYLDVPYDALSQINVPENLRSMSENKTGAGLPSSGFHNCDHENICVYNSFNLDPAWHSDEPMGRILLLEPEHFNRYPVSKKVLDFIIQLSKNIPGIRIHAGSFNSLKDAYPGSNFIFKKHPTTLHYEGTGEDPEYLFPGVNRYFPSFFSFWKKCEPFLYKR